jgi:uncharacterized iron-regulated membrane protein
MAVIQVNPPGMASTTPGYISSITVRTGGSAQALTPDATTGQVTTDAPAASQLVQDWARFKLITG